MKTSVDIHAGDLIQYTVAAIKHVHVSTVAAIKHVHVSTRKTKYCISNFTLKTTLVFDIGVRID